MVILKVKGGACNVSMFELAREWNYHEHSLCDHADKCMIAVGNNFKGLICNNEKCRRVWEVQTLASEVAVVTILKMDEKDVCEAKKSSY